MCSRLTTPPVACSIWIARSPLIFARPDRHWWTDWGFTPTSLARALAEPRWSTARSSAGEAAGASCFLFRCLMEMIQARTYETVKRRSIPLSASTSDEYVNDAAIRGEAIRSLRRRSGRRLRDIAQRLGVTVQTVSGWELGKQTPSTDHLEEIADLFSVSLDVLGTRGAYSPPPSRLGEGDLPELLLAAFRAGVEARTARRAGELLRELRSETTAPSIPELGLEERLQMKTRLGRVLQRYAQKETR